MLKLLVVFEDDEDGFVVASCPTLPGCHTQGRTRAEALANIREAIDGYLASVHDRGVPVPTSTEYEIINVAAS
ncbi:MAG: type II toxin-antitoxin system HicB family antitoxin [Dehalococcoidia bacterium]|nr:type II toxin-antitoxin system HicB family antitoxin [Dehalococcoidia bacterium]